jgi:uncharacterized protein (TIGR02284 family)
MFNNANKLNEVLEYLNDSVHGLTECADQSKDHDFKNVLWRIAQQRRVFIEELEAALKDAKIEPRRKGTLFGPLHRLLIELKVKINDNIEVLKEEILRGDEILIEKYNEAILDEENIPIKILLNQQLHYIHISLNEMTPTIAPPISIA